MASNSVLLTTGNDSVAQGLLREAAGACAALSLDQLVRTPQQTADFRQQVFLSLAASQWEAAAAAASRLLSLLQADGSLVVAIEGPQGSEDALRVRPGRQGPSPTVTLIAFFVQLATNS